MDKLKIILDKLSSHYYLVRLLERNKQYIPKEQWEKEIDDVSSRIFPIFVQNEIFDGKEYVYVLRLVDNKYYVGWTEHLMERMKDHFENGGAQWTKKYKPVEVIKVFRGTKQDEDRETLTMMISMGKENVRGGKWCNTTKEYSIDPIKILEQYNYSST